MLISILALVLLKQGKFRKCHISSPNLVSEWNINYEPLGYSKIRNEKKGTTFSDEWVVGKVVAYFHFFFLIKIK